MIISSFLRSCSSWSSSSTLSLPRAVLQWADAYLLKPYDVGGIMILQSDITDLWALRFPFRLVPLLTGRHIVIFGIKVRDPFTVQVHRNASASQRNNHRLPLAGHLFRHGGGRRERVNCAGAMNGIAATRDLDFIAVMNREPRAFIAFSRSLHLRHRFV